MCLKFKKSLFKEGKGTSGQLEHGFVFCDFTAATQAWQSQHQVHSSSPGRCSYVWLVSKWKPSFSGTKHHGTDRPSRGSDTSWAQLVTSKALLWARWLPPQTHLCFSLVWIDGRDLSYLCIHPYKTYTQIYILQNIIYNIYIHYVYYRKKECI